MWAKKKDFTGTFACTTIYTAVLAWQEIRVAEYYGTKESKILEMGLL